MRVSAKRYLGGGLFLIVLGTVTGHIFFNLLPIFPFGSVVMISAGVYLLLDGIKDWLKHVG